MWERNSKWHRMFDKRLIKTNMSKIREMNYLIFNLLILIKIEIYSLITNFIKLLNLSYTNNRLAYPKREGINILY